MTDEQQTPPHEPGGPNLPDAGDVKKKEFEEAMDAERQRQNLPEGSVPEQRPQATIQPAPVHGRVHQRLEEEESPLLGAPAMGHAEYKRAESDAQARKAEKQSMGPEMLYPGAHAYVDNPDGEGKEHHGRAIAVNGVNEYASPEDEALANSGFNANRRFAKVKSYNCSTRDGRAELLVVDADHIRRVPSTEFEKTPV